MNIAQRISRIAQLYPDKKSVVFSERRPSGPYAYPFYTFREFDVRSNQMAQRFQELGITPGMRTLLFVKPCLDFSVITFALFKVGAVPILIDPGMGLKNLLRSVKQVRPEALVSIPQVHWLRRLLSASFKSVQIKISLGPVLGRTHDLYQNLTSKSSKFPILERSDEDLSAILFTSGGTGIPKGVLYTHGILNAQTDALQKMFNLDEKQTDLPGFPLFALFTLAMGMTSVIPDMDPTKPAQCDPEKIVQNILDSEASFVAGSPAIWERVARYCLEKKIKLPSVKQVVMFGAPVRAEIHEMFQKILPQGDTYTPYGATECLPVSYINGKKLLASHVALSQKGWGTCVGVPAPGAEIKIISISDIPEKELFEMKEGEIGEIVVRGKMVTPAYFEMEEETLKAKILEKNNLWHRMGDIGRMDKEGNLWFLGRKSHRVVVSREATYFPLQVEAIFNQHPEVKRSALIKLIKKNHVTGALVIERRDGQTSLSGKFLNELRELAQTSPYSQMIEDFFLYKSFPVDVRHNIKIDRLKLAAWAQTKVD